MIAALVCLVPLVATPALHVSAGSLEARGGGWYRVTDPGLRAELSAGSGNAAELHFIYRGPTERTAPLADGELRRQIGLKLRAQDTCNVVYVMWQLAPDPGVFVSVKWNPGRATHEACGASGYINVAPEAGRRPAPFAAGEMHALRAQLDGDRVRVFADGALAFSATLPPEALRLDGPAGVRSDNAIFDFTVRVLQHAPY